MLNYPYLNDEEILAVEMLTEGKRLREIQQAVSPTVSKANFYMFLATLRRKTGIVDVQNIPQCLAYRSIVEKAQPIPELTQRQATLLQHFVKGWKPYIIAGRMGISEDEVKEQTQSTLAMLGIVSIDPRTQRQQARMHFAMHGNPNSPHREPSPTHLRILRAIADGVDLNTLPNLERADLKAMAREACQRINATCPGRNAQRKLVQAYFAKHPSLDTPQAQVDPMDDPMF